MESVEPPIWQVDRGAHDAHSVLRRSIAEWISAQPFAALTRAWGATPPSTDDAAEALEWYANFSQRWDFRRGGERNLVKPPRLTPEQERVTLEAADALGLITSFSPRDRHYDAVLILGGLVRACITRPAYAAHLVAAGYAFGEVVALGGFRVLDGDELMLAEGLEVQGSNEMDAMVSGVSRAFSRSHEIGSRETSDPSLTGTTAWAVQRYNGLPHLSVIAAPSPDPSRRANTVDTFNWWAHGRRERNMTLKGSRILLITNSIYVPYQEAGAIKALGLPYMASVETVGVPPEVAYLGDLTQTFEPYHYLQEIRSAILGYRDALGALQL